MDGLMSRDRWNHDAVCRYLKAEADLLIQLMLLLYLQGGQAPRSTELFSIECENGPSTSRGIYVHAGAVVCVTRHHKARRWTNQEFQVARYLPKVASKLVATYLVYIRPFAAMLYRVCHGGFQDARRLLFSSPDQPDRPWTAAHLSKALKSRTEQMCGSPFGMQIYRQLSIAVTERHVKHISQPFNRYDDKSAAADIEAVFAWQSGHRPIQRGTSYGIDAAFPDSLQPALLRVYRWASQEWQRFLRIEGSLCLEAPQVGLGMKEAGSPEPGRAKRAFPDAQETGTMKRRQANGRPSPVRQRMRGPRQAQASPELVLPSDDNEADPAMVTHTASTGLRGGAARSISPPPFRQGLLAGALRITGTRRPEHRQSLPWNTPVKGTS
ncbi:hypothetical protein LTR85_002039 [Meristemomyces frigidus]|nr:hypothetical protein LTR85_002039 [Meristemomyces frigidus]